MKACNQLDTHSEVYIIADSYKIGAVDQTLNADKTVISDFTFSRPKKNLTQYCDATSNFDATKHKIAILIRLGIKGNA